MSKQVVAIYWPKSAQRLISHIINKAFSYYCFVFLVKMYISIENYTQKTYKENQ